MGKEGKSISLKLEIIEKIEKRAEFENRSFSTMIEVMAEYYLANKDAEKKTL